MWQRARQPSTALGCLCLRSGKPQHSSWGLNGNTTRLGFWRSLGWGQECCAAATALCQCFWGGCVGHGVPWMRGVWFSPSGAPASMLLGGIVGALAVSPGWSPAPGVIHHIPPADREVFLHLRISPLSVSAAVAVASVGAQMGSRCGNVTALLTRPDLRWLA